MNIELVEINLDDANDIAKHANNKNVVKYMEMLPYPYTVEDAKDFINSCVKDYENEDSLTKNLGIKYNGEVIGMIGYIKKKGVNSHTAEIGYWLSEDYWKKGITIKALKMIMDDVFLDENTLILTADIFAPNIGSQKVLEKAGFEKWGVFKDGYTKNKKTYDKVMFKFSRI